MEETKAKDTIPRPAHSSKKDPASKAKTLTTLNRYAEITFEWTGGCKLTCSFLDTYIWHFVRNNSIGKQMGKSDWIHMSMGWNRCATSKSPKPLPNEIQSVASSSTWRQMVMQRTKKVHNQKVGKKRKRQANSCKKRQANCKKAQSDSAPSFWIRLNLKKSKRELSPAHIKRGYSGPGHMGGFVVVSLCDAWGLPQFSNMLHWLKTMAEAYVWRPLCLIMHDIMLKICTVCKKEVSCICCMYKIFVCTKCYVQKNICVYKKIFYLIF